MATEAEAQAIMDTALKFFKRGYGSSNKLFAKDHKGSAIRQKHADVAAKLIEDMRNKAGVIMVKKYGRTVALQARKKDAAMKVGGKLARAGNCVDMSAYAVALASQTPDIGQAWYCSIAPPGDHVFCAISVAGSTDAPGWKCVRHMREEQAAIWIVDPWADVCCLAKDYPDAFLARMRTWTDGLTLILAERLYTGLNADKQGTFLRVERTKPTAVWYTDGFLDGPLEIGNDKHVLSLGTAAKADAAKSEEENRQPQSAASLAFNLPQPARAKQVPLS